MGYQPKESIMSAFAAFLVFSDFASYSDGMTKTKFSMRWSFTIQWRSWHPNVIELFVCPSVGYICAVSQISEKDEFKHMFHIYIWMVSQPPWYWRKLLTNFIFKGVLEYLFILFATNKYLDRGAVPWGEWKDVAFEIETSDNRWSSSSLFWDTTPVHAKLKDRAKDCLGTRILVTWTTACSGHIEEKPPGFELIDFVLLRDMDS